MNRTAFALLLALPLAACQEAGPQVKNVWARDTVGGTANAAVFMTITSPVADRLIGASSPASGKTDLMTMQGGGADMMGMAYVEAIDLPANTPVSLNPAGLHVWLAALPQPLKAGRSIPLTLKFEKAGEQQVTVTIIAPAAPAPAG